MRKFIPTSAPDMTEEISRRRFRLCGPAGSGVHAW